MNTILVIVERNDHSQQVLAKACVMARHLDARLELFLCDAEHAYALRHTYDDRGTAEARSACLSDAHRFLEALRRTVTAGDLEITVDAVCESPLYEGILRKVRRGGPQLVVLSARLGGEGSNHGPSSSAWQVIRTCPAPVMLTRGVPWRPHPRFAAAVDVSDEETPGLARSILETSESLAARCHGGLEVLYSERSGAAARARNGATLLALASEFHIADTNVHVLEGDPGRTLADYARERRYDLLVLGTLTHRESLAALVGTVTSTLLEGLSCDFILVKSGATGTPAAQARAATC